MSVLVFDPATREAIQQAIDTARAHPMTLDAVMKIAKANEGLRTARHVSLDEAPTRRPAGASVQLGDYRAAISFEFQPPGLCRHLSISSPRAGTIPNMVALATIAAAFGFQHFPGEPGDFRCWTEEFTPGHYAVNILEVETPGQSGTA